MSSPLILSFDLRVSAVMDEMWPVKNTATHVNHLNVLQYTDGVLFLPLFEVFPRKTGCHYSLFYMYADVFANSMV